MIRKILSVFFVLCALPVMSVTQDLKDTVPFVDGMTAASETAEETGTSKSFSRQELAAYNGKNGNPAYVAIDGIVYDVTNVKAWKKGRHKGFTAGSDITEYIKKKSPHKLRVVKKLTRVGILKKE